MGSTKIGALSVEFVLASENFLKPLKDAQAQLKEFDKVVRPLTKTLDDIGGSLTSTGQALSLGLTAPIVAFGAVAVKQFGESAEALAILNAAIKSTGGAAGKSAEDVEKLATALQSKSLYEDDEIIRKVLNNLLTFTNISGQTFDQAAGATLNLATALHEDLQSAAIQVGKALNDPIAGVTALRRVGVQLSDSQKEQVKQFMAVNDIAGAQNVILNELQKEFGGVAEAASKAGTGPFIQLTNEMKNLTEAFGKLIVDALTPIAGYLTTAVRWVDGLSTSTKEIILVVAGFAAAVGPLLILLGTMATGLSSIISIAGTVSVALGSAGLAGALSTVAAIITGPVGIAVAIGAGVVALGYFLDKTELGHQVITEVWTDIKALAEVVWNGISAIVKSAADAIMQLWDDNKDSLLQTWNALKDAAQAVWALVGDDVKDVAHVLVDVIGGALLTLKDSWGTSFNELKVIAQTVWDLIKGLITGDLDIIKGGLEVFTGIFTLDWSKFSQGISDIWTGLWTNIKAVVTAPLELIQGTVKTFTDGVTGYFGDMYDAVVGHSFVPDMITMIAVHFGKLDGSMVQPTLTATKQATGAFQQMFSVILSAANEFASKIGGTFDQVISDATKAAQHLAAGDPIGASFYAGEAGVEAIKQIGAGRKAADAYVSAIQVPLEGVLANSQYWTEQNWNDTYKRWNDNNTAFIQGGDPNTKDARQTVVDQAKSTLEPIFDQIIRDIYARTSAPQMTYEDQKTRDPLTATTGLWYDFLHGTGWNGPDGPLIAIPGHKNGLDYVPYDNYPAMLHKGERVQTAEEAAGGSGGGVTLHIDNVTINTSGTSDGKGLADAFEQALRKAIQSNKGGIVQLLRRTAQGAAI